MNLLVDVHAHLDFPSLRCRLPEIIRNAKEAGVYRIITNGLGNPSNRAALSIAEEYDIVLPALGIYPPADGPSGIPFDIDEELEFIASNLGKIAAIGEIGLDYKEGGRKGQERIFCKQIEMAEKKDLPIIVHSRKAEEDVLSILQSYSCKKAILHCFSGKKRLIKQGIDAGFFFSIPPNIVRSHQLQDMAKEIPMKRLLTETDSPFLSPYKGTPNEPAFVIEAIKKIAEIKKMTEEETTAAIFMNFRDIFR